LGIKRAGNQIPRIGSGGNVLPFISNQFATTCSEDTKLKSRPTAAEQNILLTDRHRACVAQPNCHRLRCSSVVQSGFNLNVRWHSSAKRSQCPFFIPSASFQDSTDWFVDAGDDLQIQRPRVVSTHRKKRKRRSIVNLLWNSVYVNSSYCSGRARSDVWQRAKRWSTCSPNSETAATRGSHSRVRRSLGFHYVATGMVVCKRVVVNT
jgi:hypothetical protein